MRVFESIHITIDYFDNRSYMKVVRLGTEDLEEGAYKQMLLQWRSEIEFYKPSYQLVDYLNYYRPIPPHIQVWVKENLIVPAYKAGVKKVAFIISRDFYVQVSLEQTMQEKEGEKFVLKYFDNETDAEKWLFDEVD